MTKLFLPAGLALGLLVVLKAQTGTPEETTAPAAPAPNGAAPAAPTVETPPPDGRAGRERRRPGGPGGPRTRSVAAPPPAANGAGTVPVAAAAENAAPNGQAAADPVPAAPVVETPAVPPAEEEGPRRPPNLSSTPSAPAPAASSVAPAPAPAIPGAAPAPGAVPPPGGAPLEIPPAPGVAAPAAPLVVANPNYDSEIPDIEFVEATMDISDILDKYEAFTNRSTMRDVAVGPGTALPLRSNGKMTRKQAADYIKSFLLLNGFSIIPSDIENVDKVIPTMRGPQVEQGGSVRPVYSNLDTSLSELPETDQIINYVLYLKNIGAEEAARTFQTIFPQGRHGGVSKITPIPAAGALIITESVPAIRLALALKEKIDVPSAQVTKKFFQLERADAEEVAQVLTEILAAQSKLRNQASGGAGGGGARGVPVNQAAQQLQGLPPGVVPDAGGASGGGGSQPPDESTVIVKAITRTNEVLVSGRPNDLEYLEDLIKELDKEANVKNLKRFQLRFIRVEDFLEIAQDAIGRGQEAIQGGAGGGGGGGVGGAAVRSTGGGGRMQNTGTFGGGGGFGGGGNFSSAASRGRTGATATGGGGSGGLSRGRSSSTGGSTQDLVPSSTIVGKTLLIAEPRSNCLLVAGPPEHLSRIEEVLDEMDRRPLQVAISAVIAEINLTDDLEHGVDIIRKAESIVAGGQDITWAGALTNTGNTSGIIDPSTLTNVAAFSGVGSGLGLYGALGEFFNVYIKAIESTGRAQVLHRPFVFTANNKEANIAIGRRIPVPANTQSNVSNGTTTFNTNVEYEDVNLEILVTPLINSKNEVTLTISETNDGLGAERQVGDQIVPEITQQTLDTEITVPNGGIAVLGGLIQESDSRSHSSVPWLARIPILRSLMGNTAKERRRSELLIFIQPRIVETAEELEAMHTDQVRRTAVGKEAEKFAKPAYNTRDVMLPTENGDIPLDSAHTLLPQTGDGPSAPPAPTSNTLKAVDLQESPTARPASRLDSTLPDEKRQAPFWEKNDPATTPPTENTPTTKKNNGLKRILPWNWGKKRPAEAL